MRGFLVIVLVSILLIRLMPVEAQSSYPQGFYEFENEVANMTYTGTWTSGAIAGLSSSLYRQTTVAGSSVTFIAGGTTVVIWRIIRPTSASSRMNICVNVSSCVSVINESSGPQPITYPYVLTVPSVGSSVTITHTLGTVFIDSFMILAGAGGTFPTPVPTATILPSSTPASTTTPQPTPTPQPTTTPISVIWSIDPAKSYSSIDGQITSVEYSATAADIHLANLLKMLLFSIWGMFIFVVFVLVRFKR